MSLSGHHSRVVGGAGCFGKVAQVAVVCILALQTRLANAAASQEACDVKTLSDRSGTISAKGTDAPAGFPDPPLQCEGWLLAPSSDVATLRSFTLRIKAAKIAEGDTLEVFTAWPGDDQRLKSKYIVSGRTLDETVLRLEAQHSVLVTLKAASSATFLEIRFASEVNIPLPFTDEKFVWVGIVVLCVLCPPSVLSIARVRRKLNDRAAAAAAAKAAKQLKLGKGGEQDLENVERVLSDLPPKPWFKGGFGSQEDCCLCLESFEEGEMVRELVCGHFHHADCIDPWLSRPAGPVRTCPWCKQDPSPKSQGAKEHAFAAKYAPPPPMEVAEPAPQDARRQKKLSGGWQLQLNGSHMELNDDHVFCVV